MFHSTCPELDFAGQVVIVTGGGKGVGRGIATRFLAAGAEVIVCGRTTPDSLPEAGGRRAEFVHADIRELDDIERLISTAVDRHRRLDVLINNAGGSPPADAATASPRFGAKIIQINLISPMWLA